MRRRKIKKEQNKHQEEGEEELETNPLFSLFYIFDEKYSSVEL